MANSVSEVYDYSDYGEWYLLELEIEKILESRKAKRVIEKLIAEPPAEEGATPGEPVEAYFEQRAAKLRQQIRQLKDEIEARYEMESQFLHQLDYQIGKAATSLKEFQFWGIGYNTGVDVKRNFLERQLADLRKERRNTELKTWEDIIALRKELREALGEYHELKRRAGLMDYRGEEHGD